MARDWVLEARRTVARREMVGAVGTGEEEDGGVLDGHGEERERFWFGSVARPM